MENILSVLLTSESYVQPTRNFSLAYIIIDALFVVSFVVILFLSKRKVTAYWALAGGLLYFIVDFGIFYAALGSRQIYSYVGDSSNVNLLSSLNTMWVLLWMSMSYGITDFAFIWIWLNNDKRKIEYSSLIVVFWICCPLIASFINNLNPNMVYFETTRSTDKYHGIMGLIMLVGYFIIILMNIFSKKEEKIPIIRLFVIGFMAQFLWEFILLVFNIRSQTYSSDILRTLSTLIQDSLVETNLGMPYIYFIHKVVSSRWNEDTTKKERSVA